MGQTMQEMTYIKVSQLEVHSEHAFISFPKIGVQIQSEMTVFQSLLVLMKLDVGGSSVCVNGLVFFNTYEE